VVWASKDHPGFNHDIRSVDAHSGAIWIEVKSTTGFDGTFDWSIAEFERALSEGPRHQLWRVYDVAGTTAIADARICLQPITLERPLSGRSMFASMTDIGRTRSHPCRVTSGF